MPSTILEDLPLIRSITWQFAKRRGIEFDDLFSEACIAFLEEEPRFDPSRASKSTFMWHMITHRLSRMANGESRDQQLPDESEIQDDALTPERELLVKERWANLVLSLSPEAQTIVQITLDESRHALPIDTPKHCRGALVRRLRNEGWSWAAIWRGFREIKHALAA